MAALKVDISASTTVKTQLSGRTGVDPGVLLDMLTDILPAAGYTVPSTGGGGLTGGTR